MIYYYGFSLVNQSIGPILGLKFWTFNFPDYRDIHYVKWALYFIP